MLTAIQLDKPSTWHEELAAFVDRTANVLRRTGRVDSEYACDLVSLDPSGEIAAGFSATFDSEMVLCYHATRLLHHEISDIAEKGLDTVTDELRKRKLAGAQARHPGVLTDRDVELLLRSGPLSWQPAAVRNGLLWFVTPWRAVINERDGLGYLLGRWGGEAIGWTNGDDARCEHILQRLDEISLPAVVEFLLPPRDFASYASPWCIPVGKALGLKGLGTESNTKVSIPPRQVIRVRTSLDPDWPDELSIAARSR